MTHNPGTEPFSKLSLLAPFLTYETVGSRDSIKSVSTDRAGEHPASYIAGMFHKPGLQDAVFVTHQGIISTQREFA